jgi:hypothetical protein
VPEGLFEKPSSSVCFTLKDVYKALLVFPDDKGSSSPTTLQANIDHAINKAFMSRLGSSSGSGRSPGKGNSDGQGGLHSSVTHAERSDIESTIAQRMVVRNMGIVAIQATRSVKDFTSIE